MVLVGLYPLPIFIIAMIVFGLLMLYHSGGVLVAFWRSFSAVKPTAKESVTPLLPYSFLFTETWSRVSKKQEKRSNNASSGSRKGGGSKSLSKKNRFDRSSIYESKTTEQSTVVSIPTESPMSELPLFDKHHSRHHIPLYGSFLGFFTSFIAFYLWLSLYLNPEAYFTRSDSVVVDSVSWIANAITYPLVLVMIFITAGPYFNAPYNFHLFSFGAGAALSGLCLYLSVFSTNDTQYILFSASLFIHVILGICAAISLREQNVISLFRLPNMAGKYDWRAIRITTVLRWASSLVWWYFLAKQIFLAFSPAYSGMMTHEGYTYAQAFADIVFSLAFSGLFTVIHTEIEYQKQARVFDIHNIKESSVTKSSLSSSSGGNTDDSASLVENYQDEY